jgi:serine-aspartate repeat-containing protein C/D/E
MFDADPIWVGGVYVEEDQGGDGHGDTFYVTFNGGAPNTKLTRLALNTDQNAPGYTVADNLFDITEGGMGADHAFPFKLERLIARDPNAKVTASVADGSTQLILTFENFYAGDQLIFSIDVDEVQHFDPAERNLSEINLGLDPITSGVEFQGTKFQASFTAPHYENIEGQSIFQNRYDTLLAPSKLNLPADNERGLRDRTAGTAFNVVQVPKPISIAGTVFIDNNVNLKQDADETGIQGVVLELFRKEGNQYVTTSHRATTDAQGRYRFGLDLKLQPGTYQVRETQPNGYFSVGAIPGLLDGRERVGQTLADNKDLLTEILIPFGDQQATQLDFAEAQPANIRGYVYEDLNDNGRRDAGENGIGGVEIQLMAIDAIASVAMQSVRTDSDGSYRFSNLPPGRYKVVESSQPSAYFDGQDTPGNVGGVSRGTVLVNDAITDILLNGNDTGIDYNFGELPPASLSGHVCVAMPGFDCFSTDPNGKRPLTGIKVELFDGNGRSVAMTTTGTDGSYRFEKLPAGIYSIVESTPVDLIDGGAKRGTVNGLTVGAIDDPSRISQIRLGAGQNGRDYDFCEVPPASLSGHVFEDTNDDGIRQSEEPPIAKVTVALLDAAGNQVGQVETDANGFYKFSSLRPGTYRLVETTPAGFIDGKDRVGTIQGTPVGRVDSAADTISQIDLPAGRDGIDYDFGELRPGSIAGQVIVDTDGNCMIDADGDRPLPGVTMELLDTRGTVVSTTTTDLEGRYRFEGILPGSYSIREAQPAGYFDGDQKAGSGGGDVSKKNEITKIPLLGGQALVDYNFCEVPPAIISGYVFQDGPVLVTQDNKVPERLRPLRDGVRDASDTPLAGVVMELRTILGQPFPSDRALPGIYDGPSIVVTTDANGYFEFRGLRPGSYHIYQQQPTGYIDGLDTAGTTGGISINMEDIIDDLATLALLDSLTQDESTNPRNDAILRVSVTPGGISQENNFSEIRIEVEPTPVPPLGTPPTPFEPPPENGYPQLPFDRVLVAVPPAPYTPPLLIAGASIEYSWHLSIINSGMPRGALSGKQVARSKMAQAASVLNVATWTLDEADASQWTFVATDQNKLRTARRQSFDIDGATTLAGDFNGDGQDELALYLEGEWLIDINGNGRWDRGDMWAKLGDEDDLPVIGDWDADGKDDIGVFGPEWEGDDRALEREPGLPDPENQLLAKPKNVPRDADETPEQERLLQRSATGPARADVIDHVFRFGVKDDQPIAGDFNGDGVSSVGLFRDGRWRLDVNGDGRWTEEVDKSFEFGQTGDIAVVGDFDGDGVDEVAVIRGNRLIIDSNRNEKLDATDRVFELEGNDGDIVVGDFDGDGKDEAALIQRSEGFKTRSADGLTREARKAS